ncbi:MAG TPA: hypothetical protein VHW25_14415 [Steroidobacteraceae bacterium]|jgi:hypothetical protein|nr:hypothetical protein [Steroidobacteraceae bacterium]
MNTHTTLFTGAVKRLANLGAAFAAAALLLSAPQLARASDSDSEQPGARNAQNQCFNRREWKGLWKTAPDARTMYIKVAHRVYRLDLDTAYPLLKSPWALLSNTDASNVICNPIDFRLVVSDRLGVSQSVIVRHMSVLAPAEVASLPKDLRPS